MFSCEFSKISKNTFFTEHLWTATSAFSFSEAATGGALWKKVFFKILQNSQENTFGSRNFQKHLFYRTPLDDCFWFFRAKLLKWGTAKNVWKISDEYSLSRNTNLRSTVQVYPEAVVWRCSVKKVFLEISLNSQKACNFIKKETLAQVLSCEFCEIFKNSFFCRTSLVAASVFHFFGRINFQCMSSLLYTVYCQKRPSE